MRASTPRYIVVMATPVTPAGPVVDDRHTVDSDASGLASAFAPLGLTERAPLTMLDESNLQKQGYSTGLARALAENAARYDFRFWVLDNSGSMRIGDGHRLVNLDGGKRRSVKCTRWEELQETVQYHAQMAAAMDSPVIFQLLNDPGMKLIPARFGVCERGPSHGREEVNEAVSIMRKVSPSGVTPITRHITFIRESIARMAPELRRRGKAVAVILATDGLPTDAKGCGGERVTDEFVHAIRTLEGLPVWTVVRLCTDDPEVREFYNSLDEQLELSVEVLDDFNGEAREVYKHNPWICYAEPLHRIRELGYHDRLFDMIDERPLTMGEARKFCCFVLGVDEYDLPDPAVDAKPFIKSLNTRLEREKMQFNPMKKKMTPWILTKELKKSFSNKNCTIM